MNLTLNELNKMKEVDIRTVDKEQLMDLNAVTIDDKEPIEERVTSFFFFFENPYCFRVGDVAVKVVYQENDPTFQQNFEDMLMNL